MLPLEILTDILLTLDLPSLIVFRHVNRRAIGLIDSLHQFRMVYRSWKLNERILLSGASHPSFPSPCVSCICKLTYPMAPKLLG
ncbi:hypothetical protein GGR53DRAFT_506157 [Hypoxylon sp. FL1150]|nr:hypothetical protein GGR53DRAFT_506157 [Hypoxylon sp. FL1150]